MGCEEHYQEKHIDYDERTVLKYLISAPDNSNSIINSLRQARENARLEYGTETIIFTRRRFTSA